MTHSGSLSSSNLFLKYKTPVTPTAYSSVNHQKKKNLNNKKQKQKKGMENWGNQSKNPSPESKAAQAVERDNSAEDRTGFEAW